MTAITTHSLVKPRGTLKEKSQMKEVELASHVYSFMILLTSHILEENEGYFNQNRIHDHNSEREYGTTVKRIRKTVEGK